jgi:3-oxoacyl-[acyl-carrier protein] reductase
MGVLDGKTALVTGASKGIGAAIARALGQAGAQVVVNYTTSKAGADRIVSEIVSQGGSAVAVKANVAKAAELQALFAETEKVFGVLDILVNNAGVYSFGPLESVTEDEFHRQFNTNVLGAMLACQEAVKLFPKTGGSIINIGTAASETGIPHAVIYLATKSGLDAITRVLAQELGPRNIRVNSLNPGGTETEGAHAIGIIGSDFQKQLIAKTPLGRFGKPDDIAQVAVFFASDAAAWLTGEIVHVSGGAR